MEHSDKHAISEQTIYTQNLQAAKNFFAAKLESLSLPELEEVFLKITQRFLFNIYTMAGGVEVFVAFETMNNRGKPLSHLELMKNRLIFLTTRLGIDGVEKAKVRKDVNESWKTIYYNLGRNKNNPISDDRFLSVHFAVYFGLTVSPPSEGFERSYAVRELLSNDRFKEMLLDRLFTSRNVAIARASTASLAADKVPDTLAFPITVHSIYEYAKDLKKNVLYYYEMLNPSDSGLNADQRAALTRLNRLGWYDAEPLTLLASSERGKSEFTEYLNQLERFLFLRYFLLDRTRYADYDLIRLMLELKSKKASLGGVVDELRAIIDLLARTLEVKQLLSKSLASKSYYGWRGLIYFLFEYELHLASKSRTHRDKMAWEYFFNEDYSHDYSTVEHIYPQKDADPYWQARFGGFPEKQKDLLKNSLGNLLPLSRPRNSSFSNRSFPDKKTGVGEVIGYSGGSYSEVEVARESDWTAMEILKRGLKMLRFMEKNWSFKLKNDDDRVRALGLEFLLDEWKAQKKP